jgi:hypothetical protein
MISSIHQDGNYHHRHPRQRTDVATTSVRRNLPSMYIYIHDSSIKFTDSFLSNSCLSISLEIKQRARECWEVSVTWGDDISKSNVNWN